MVSTSQLDLLAATGHRRRRHARRGRGGVHGPLVGLETEQHCARPPSVRRLVGTYGQKATQSGPPKQSQQRRTAQRRARMLERKEVQEVCTPLCGSQARSGGTQADVGSAEPPGHQADHTKRPRRQSPTRRANVGTGQSHSSERPGRMAPRRRAYRDGDHPHDPQRVVDRDRGGAEAPTSATAADDDTDSSRLSCAHRAAADGSRLTPVAGPRRSRQKHETSRGATTRRAGGPTPGILHSTGTDSRGTQPSEYTGPPSAQKKLQRRR